MTKLETYIEELKEKAESTGCPMSRALLLQLDPANTINKEI